MNQEASRSTKDRLIEAAIDQFSVHGFNGVSIRDITRIVGIKESSFYKHFTSKEALLDCLLEMFRERYARLMPPLDQIDAILDRNTPESFWNHGLELFKQQMTNPTMEKLNRILNLEQYRNPKARELILDEVIRKPLLFTETVLSRMMEKGQIRRFDPSVLAVEYQMPLYALSLEYLILHQAGMDPAPVEHQIREHIRFFSRIIQIEPETKES